MMRSLGGWSLFFGILLVLAISACSDGAVSQVTCETDGDCDPRAECMQGYCVLRGDAELDAGDGDIPLEDDVEIPDPSDTQVPDADDPDMGLPDVEPPCDEDLVLCGGECVDLTSDEDHCGDCEIPCPVGDGFQCIDGDCQCPGELVDCEGKCSDLNSPDTCGDCDVSCDQGEGEICAGAGGCVLDCPEGQENCGGTCVDTTSSTAHCGGCVDNGGEACSAPEGATAVCTDQGCSFDCDDELTECDGQCVDTTSSTAHCGGCADDGGETCEAPDNATAVCTDEGCSFVCDGELVACEGQCVDVETSVEYCGGCPGEPDHQECISPENGEAVCVAGTCGIDCDETFEQCASQCVPQESTLLECDGLCVDTENNDEFCGSCTNNCLPENEVCLVDQCVACIQDEHCDGGQICDDNVCVDAPEPTTRCYDGDVDVDVNLMNDPAHCGGCFNECGVGTTGSCTAGHCEPIDDCGEGAGTAEAPYIICTTGHLQDRLLGTTDGEALSAHYLLGDDLSFAPSNSPPFEVIGNSENEFEGVLDGNNYKITDFEIPFNSDVRGFFAHIGEAGIVRNLVLEDVAMDGGNDDGGLLAGINDGWIENVHVIGVLEGDERIGGLVGRSRGTILRSSADVEVTGNDVVVGGLVGQCGGCTIVDSHAFGDVTNDALRVGGLVGDALGASEILRSSAHGMVFADSQEEVGGLVGRLESIDGEVRESYATGIVNAPSSNKVGGLIGLANEEGVVANCYATGNVTGGDRVGGLIGHINRSGARISETYSIGVVTGDSNVGGLVGEKHANSDDTVQDSFWWYDPAVNDDQADSSDGGEPRDAGWFATESNFSSIGWEFDGIWRMGEQLGGDVPSRPILDWQP